jgi:iron-sulfur cluster repair protein YtfE (RIC family)
MSQPQTADQDAARAVVDHHAALAATLETHTARLLDAAGGDDAPLVWRHRDALAGWIRDELLPHAAAEEETLYPAAAARAEGRLLVDGMIAEHHAIAALVTELAGATSPVRAAAAARSIAALFAIHLAKENDLILPLLRDTADVSLAALLGGMHELLGASH